jgi:hypothetical protein
MALHILRIGEFDPSDFVMTLVTFASYWLQRKERVVIMGNNMENPL